MWLIGLQNVFSYQLPRMPREYISRLIFDPYVLLFTIDFSFVLDGFSEFSLLCAISIVVYVPRVFITHQALTPNLKVTIFGWWRYYCIYSGVLSMPRIKV